MESYFIEDMIHDCHYLFWFSNWPRFGHFLAICKFFTFWLKIFKVHHVLPLPQPWNQLNFQGAQVPFGGEWCLDINIWVLSGLIAKGVSVFPGPLSGHS